MSGSNGSEGGGAQTDRAGPEQAETDASADWSVYILRCADGSLYTGITNRLLARLHAHAEGRGAKYTRSRLPVELVWEETRPDRSAALRREAEIKTYTRAQKMALIAAVAKADAPHNEDEKR